VTAELEFQQLDRRYEALRRRSPEREKQLLTSLAARGQQLPIIVVAVEGNQRVVVDGYKRVRALLKLRRDVVLATEWALPEADALLLEWRMRTGEAADPMEQAWLLRELRERFDLSEEELGKRFEKSKSWVSRRLALVSELPEEVQEGVRRGELGAHAAMKYLVPLARANLGDCLALTKALTGKKPTSRQVAQLYTAILSGGAEGRALLLREPWLFLRAQEEARREQAKAKERTPAELLLGDFGALGGIVRRLHQRLRQGMCEQLKAVEKTDLRHSFLTVKAEMSALQMRCERELPDAG
jgi:ParB family transcriptional regulator, chromosome partitioning protein